MKKILYFTVLLCSATIFSACESTPDQTINEAAQHFEKGVSGQGTLVERDWSEVTNEPN
ncbi:MAG: hypothetical protein Q8Q33_09815 [Chlamydiota bacterium]|nr:hypothetical protein [Chlamydiota bacterium]